MPEPILLALALAGAALFVAQPILGPRRPGEDVAAVEVEASDARAARDLRRRLALEEIRELEADHRAGRLDPAAHADQLAEAEASAAAADRWHPPSQGLAPPRASAARRRTAAGAFLAIGVMLVVGSLVPASGIANATETNEALAEAEAREAIRQERIRDLLAVLDEDPSDPEALSDLADAYLAGSSPEDLATAAIFLRALIEIEPERADAYERIIGAYLRARDAENARAALDAYRELSVADPVQVAFLGGLVARAEGDDAGAIRAFDRFLELAPDDPRAPMVESLRADLGGS